MPKYKVLSTKKLSPSLIEQAKQQGIAITEQEFIAIKPIWSEEKYQEVRKWAEAGISHIAVTSANTADILNRYLHWDNTVHQTGWKIFCISGKTKEHMLQHFQTNDIIATADYGKNLAQKIVEYGVKEIVFFCGNKRRDELPAILKQHNIAVHEVVLYETIQVPSIATDDMGAVLFFSPSAVQSFFSVNQLKENTVCFAIGTTTADAIANYTHNKVIVSEAPSQETLLAAVTNYFTNKVNL